MPPTATLTLRDVLPNQAFRGEWKWSEKKLNTTVLATHNRHWWPGRHKHVIIWWELSDGTALGWNENTSTGWSFPVIRYPKA